MGDSLLQGTEAPTCQPNQSSREASCLLGAGIWDVVEELLKLVWLSDYNLLLLLHVGANDTARGNLDSIGRDYRALGVVVTGIGAQVVVSVLLAR